MLLASALYPLHNGEIKYLRACINPCIDWGFFDALVNRHRLIPTVYRNLSTHAPELVPQDILLSFKRQVGANQQLILKALGELSRIARQFKDEGIQLCALKGPLLAQRLFGDVSLRTSHDIDLLIQPEEVRQAEKLLQDSGYQRSYPPMPLTPRQWRSYQKYWRHFIYHHPGREILTELHWAFTPTALLSMQEVRRMLSRTRSVAFAGTSIDLLSEGDLPISLLLHGTMHSWIRLKWLADFVAWMRTTGNPDWEGLLARMSELGLQRVLAQGLLLSNRLFNTPIPEQVQPAIAAEPAAQYLVDRSMKSILNERFRGEDMGRVHGVRHILYWMWLKKDLRYKWHTLENYLVVPGDWFELPLPDALYPLYLFFRPLLGLKRNLFP